jgi:hypothetical protein
MKSIAASAPFLGWLALGLATASCLGAPDPQDTTSQTSSAAEVSIQEDELASEPTAEQRAAIAAGLPAEKTGEVHKTFPPPARPYGIGWGGQSAFGPGVYPLGYPEYGNACSVGLACTASTVPTWYW